MARPREDRHRRSASAAAPARPPCRPGRWRRHLGARRLRTTAGRCRAGRTDPAGEMRARPHGRLRMREFPSTTATLVEDLPATGLPPGGRAHRAADGRLRARRGRWLRLVPGHRHPRRRPAAGTLGWADLAARRQLRLGRCRRRNRGVHRARRATLRGATGETWRRSRRCCPGSSSPASAQSR